MTGASEWQGRVGDIWAAEWRRTDRSLAGLGRELDAAILAVAPHGGSAVDIGAGAGATSISLATARASLDIVGIDLSPSLVSIARDHAGVRPNLRFIAGDVMTSLPALAPVDLLVSRHGVMFFADPVAGLAAFRQAAAPGAPLVFSCFAAPADNGWTAVAAAVGAPPPGGGGAGPFAFADADRTVRLLTAAGWRDAAPVRVEWDYVAGQGADPVNDAIEFFSHIGPAAPTIAALPDADRPAALASLTDLLERHRTADVVTFCAAAGIWSARAGEEPA